MNEFMNKPTSCENVSVAIMKDYQAGISIKELTKIYLMTSVEVKKVIKEGQ